MCLILFAYDTHRRYKIIFAANRDEFFDRRTKDAHFWAGDPAILGGLDLKEGGTWMGITKGSRYGAVTNYRDPSAYKPTASSRGGLVANYLRGNEQPDDYARRIESTGGSYNGFNLLIGDTDELWYLSNKGIEAHKVDPGVYGLSNHVLNTAWPKVRRGRALFLDILDNEQINPDELLALLRDRTIAEDCDLPSTGIGLEWERALSPIFIHTPTYGTRSSTVLLIDRGGMVSFVEHTYDSSANAAGTRSFSFQIEP